MVTRSRLPVLSGAEWPGVGVLRQLWGHRGPVGSTDPEGVCMRYGPIMRSGPRALLSSLVGVALAASGVLVATAASAAPRPPIQADALGDSYAAGVGVPPYDGPCARSQSAYAVQLDGRMKIELDDFVACAGATTATLAGGQLNALDDRHRPGDAHHRRQRHPLVEAVGACLDVNDATAPARSHDDAGDHERPAGAPRHGLLQVAAQRPRSSRRRYRLPAALLARVRRLLGRVDLGAAGHEQRRRPAQHQSSPGQRPRRASSSSTSPSGSWTTG